MSGDGRYQIDVEVQESPDAVRAPYAPGWVYEEWVRSHVEAWQTRDIVIVSGPEWRDVAAGRGLLEALELADFPRMSFTRTIQPGMVGLRAMNGRSSQIQVPSP